MADAPHCLILPKTQPHKGQHRKLSCPAASHARPTRIRHKRRGTNKCHALYCPRAFTPSQISSVLSKLPLIAHIRTILIVNLLTWHELKNEQHYTADIRDKAYPVPPSAASCVMQSPNNNRYTRTDKAQSQKQIDNDENPHSNILVSSRKDTPQEYSRQCPAKENNKHKQNEVPVLRPCCPAAE